MLRSLIKKTIFIAAMAVAIAIPATAAADTIVGSTAYLNFKPGVDAQWSAVCDPAFVVDGYPTLSHGDELDMPVAWLGPLNVTSGIDSQIVSYTAYLLRWNGSTWVYLKDSSGNYIYQTASVFVSEQNPSGVSSSLQFTLRAPGAGYYRVAISASWRRTDTNAIAQSLLYWAPITEANGSNASYCTFGS